MLPITSVHSGLAALWPIWLTGVVVRLRRAHRVSLGDGGYDDLRLERAPRLRVIGMAMILSALFSAVGLVLHGLADVLS